MRNKARMTIMEHRIMDLESRLERLESLVPENAKQPDSDAGPTFRVGPWALHTKWIDPLPWPSHKDWVKDPHDN